MRTVLLACAVLTGCGIVYTVGSPGGGVDDSIASRYGCSAQEIKARARELKAALPSGQTYTPQVGWSACDVLAHVGIPTRSSLVATTSGRAEHWYYTTSISSGLVVLDVTSNGHRVSSVVW